MASEEILIPPEHAKTPPILPKDDTPPKERPERNSSPEENCSICLNEFENKSFTDSCFHKFCFVCILEWSKVKAVCPLCKTSFKSIIHNIVSNEIYDQYHLQPNNPPVTDDQDGRRFRYRTTLTDDHRYAWELRRNNTFLRITREERRHHHEQRLQNQRNAAYNYRRYIYALGLRVKQTRWNRFSGYRDVSLGFFQRNPATVYRLVPWLQRDLSVIFNGDDNNILFVTELILSLIRRVDIQSQEFRNNLEGFLLNKTDHFVHEFVSFARSPYDLETYDQMVQYNYSRQSEPPVDINEPLLVISSDSDSDTHDIILDLSAHSREELIPTHNPLPPVESELNIAPGTSGESSNILSQVVKKEKNSNETTGIDVTSAPSDVEIIGYLKPYHERTPEVVVLSSDTEQEEQPTCRKCGQPKHSSKCKKIKRKPKTTLSSYDSYRPSNSPQSYRKTSNSRSRSQSRRKHDRRSQSSSTSHSGSRRIKIKKRSSKYNWVNSSSSSPDYSSGTEDYSKNYQMSKSKLFDKYKRNSMKYYKSSNIRSDRSPSSHRSQRSRSRTYRSRSRSAEHRPHRSRSRSVGHKPYRSRSQSVGHRPYRSRSRSIGYRHRSRSRSVEDRSHRSRSRSIGDRSHRSRDRSVEERAHRSRDRSAEERAYRSTPLSVECRPRRSRSRSHSRSPSKSRNSPTRSYKSHSRSHSRSKSRSHGSYRSQTKSRSHDHESLLDGHDNSDLKYKIGDGKSSNARDKERQNIYRNSSKSHHYRSSSKSKYEKKRFHSSYRSGSTEEFEKKTNSINRKKRSKEKQEARRKRREKRRKEMRRRAAEPKDFVFIDLTQSADDNRDEITSQALLFEEEISTMNQFENNHLLPQTSGVGPMRAMVPDDVSQNKELPSLDAVDGLLSMSELQPIESIHKTAFDLLIEAEKARLQKLLDRNSGSNFGQNNDME